MPPHIDPDKLSFQDRAAYGGPGWSPRARSLQEEIGGVWAACGLDSECSPLQAVLLHRPGPELTAAPDPNSVQFLEIPDPGRAAEQHEALANAYRAAGVAVHYVEPAERPPPNLMFVADLFFMTPEGALLGRPASTVRAGEERALAVALARLGVPILYSVRGRGTFEGADALWIAPDCALLATGLRTNAAGAAQVSWLLKELGSQVVRVELPPGVMHLMGVLRVVADDLAIAWPGRLPPDVLAAIRRRGLEVLFIPDEREAILGQALNFVTLRPRRILMPAGNPRTQEFYERAGVRCETVAVDELLKAAGGIGCLTGILRRERRSP